MFGRLLYMIVNEHTYLVKVFTYTTCSYSTLLVLVDDGLNKTDNSRLLNSMKNMCNDLIPSSVDVTIVDAIFLMHTL